MKFRQIALMTIFVAIPCSQALADNYGFKTIDFKGLHNVTLAPNGTVWSGFQGSYANNGVAVNGAVTNSPATNACEKIEWKLPGYNDFHDLLAIFSGSNDDIRLYAPELKQLNKVFPFFGRIEDFWTATINPNGFLGQNDGDVYDAFILIDHVSNGIGDIQGDRLNPGEQAGVVCVNYFNKP